MSIDSVYCMSNQSSQDVEKPGQEEEDEEDEGGKIKKQGDEEQKQEAGNDGTSLKVKIHWRNTWRWSLKQEKSSMHRWVGSRFFVTHFRFLLSWCNFLFCFQSPGREEAGHTSPEAKSLSDEKDHR